MCDYYVIGRWQVQLWVCFVCFKNNYISLRFVIDDSYVYRGFELWAVYIKVCCGVHMSYEHVSLLLVQLNMEQPTAAGCRGQAKHPAPFIKHPAPFIVDRWTAMKTYGLGLLSKYELKED